MAAVRLSLSFCNAVPDLCNSWQLIRERTNKKTIKRICKCFITIFLISDSLNRLLNLLPRLQTNQREAPMFRVYISEDSIASGISNQVANGHRFCPEVDLRNLHFLQQCGNFDSHISP